MITHSDLAPAIVGSDAGKRPTFVRRLPMLMALPARCLMRWYDRWIERQHLGELEDHLLDDIGLSRERARREAMKHFWQ